MVGYMGIRGIVAREVVGGKHALSGSHPVLFLIFVA